MLPLVSSDMEDAERTKRTELSWGRRRCPVLREP
jgi:hypothetical protein